MPANTSQPVLEYSYEHASTRATTGFFCCIPKPEPEFDSALQILVGRPHDTFLHRHVLQLMADLPDAALLDLAKECKPEQTDRARLLACLMLELAKTGRIAFEKERPELAPQTDLTPLPILFGSGHEDSLQIRECFFQNIHAHKPLPISVSPDPEPVAGCTTLADLRAGMADTTGESVPDARATATAALEYLTESELATFPEMRHEASLSPIALLRQWPLNLKITNGRNAHTLSGIATAYGRGLSLAAARASCLMEIVERSCAYASIDKLQVTGRDMELERQSHAQLGDQAIDPVTLGAPEISRQARLHWLPSENAAGQKIYVPASAVFLFANLDEPDFFEDAGSTGLAAGNTRAQARLAALLEVLERHAHATTPFSPDTCFRIRSRDERIQGLLDDYAARRIHPLFQDLHTEFGLPAYRCFVVAPDGGIAQATGSGLCGARAALSALTETPWPYSWATPAPFGQPTRPPDWRLPLVWLEDLPDYSLSGIEANLALLEKTLEANGLMPVYADISRRNMPFHVTRALVPGLATYADFDGVAPLPPLLLARARRLGMVF